MIPDLQTRLRAWRRRGLWRRRRCYCPGTENGRVRLPGDERACLSFISNDYLDVSAHPQVREAVVEAARRYGHGSGGSALMGGYHELARAVEEELADWLDRDAAVLLGSGFLANLAVGQSVSGQQARPLRDDAQAGGRWLADHNAHASIIDATRLSGWPLTRFRHNDFDHLRDRLDAARERELAVITEGLFSMDGDIPCWSKLTEVVGDRACLIVDEAHSFGVLGSAGRGAVAHLGQARVPLVVVPLGKAAGGYGALICGQQLYIDAVVEFARSYIYSTALPPALVAGNLASVRLLAQLDEQRQRLKNNIAYLRQCLGQAGLSHSGDSASPVTLIPCPDNESALEMAGYLYENSILIGAIRAPTTARPRLRISLRAGHNRGDIDELVQRLAQAGRRALRQ